MEISVDCCNLPSISIQTHRGVISDPRLKRSIGATTRRSLISSGDQIWGTKQRRKEGKIITIVDDGRFLLDLNRLGRFNRKFYDCDQ